MYVNTFMFLRRFECMKKKVFFRVQPLSPTYMCTNIYDEHAMKKGRLSNMNPTKKWGDIRCYTFFNTL